MEMNGLIRKKSQHVLFNVIIPCDRDVYIEAEEEEHTSPM